MIDASCAAAAPRAMLEAREKMRLHHASLSRLAQPSGYQATGGATDFGAALTAAADELAAAQP
jgi:hypothetical protein